MNPNQQSQAMVETLNRAMENDAKAMRWLFSCRAACNESIADDPHIVVGSFGDGWDVGPLGVINGLLVSAGMPKIAAVCEEGTEQIVRFVVCPTV